MEHLHTLIDGIDGVKEHLTDNEYLKLMNAVGKLGEIINTKSDIDDDDSISNDEETDILDDNEDEPDVEINIVDIELLLKTIDENELLFRNYMNENNLPADFINSKFNVINKSAYNYVNNKTCNCEEDELCTNNNLLSCKNYQNIILKFPLIHIITRDCSNCINGVCNDINKYNLFSFDGSITISNNTTSEIFTKYSIILMDIVTNANIENTVLLFINLFYYIFENGHLLLENESLKECCCNKLLIEVNNQSITQHLPYWSNLLNIDSNIINNMINNLIELKFIEG